MLDPRMKNGQPVTKKKHSNRKSIPPFRSLVIGPPGTGKTTSLGTLPQTGLETHVIALDPGSAVLAGSGVHYRYLPYGVASWETLKEVARHAKGVTEESLKVLGRIGGDKEFTEFIDLLDLLSSFQDADSGEVLGDVAQWGPNRVLCIDGLTGLSKMARYLVAGAKPSLTQPEWGSAMHYVAMFLDTCTLSLGCHFVLTAHIEHERDEFTGQVFKTVSTLGRKLAPTIPVNFNDVVLAWEDKGNYGWATSAEGFDLKHMFLPSSSELQPSFVSLVEEWTHRGGVMSSAPWRG